MVPADMAGPARSFSEAFGVRRSRRKARPGTSAGSLLAVLPARRSLSVPGPREEAVLDGRCGAAKGAPPRGRVEPAAEVPGAACSTRLRAALLVPGGGGRDMPVQRATKPVLLAWRTGFFAR